MQISKDIVTDKCTGGQVMKKRFVSCFVLCVMIFLVSCPDLQAIMVTDKFDMGGYLQNETAFSTGNGGDALWCENKALFYGTYNFTDELRAFFRVQGYYDAIKSVQSHDYRDITGDRYMNQETYFRKNLWQANDYTSSEILKELFIDLNRPKFDLRIGKQQFAWGVTDGLKVLDVVYPQDFRKFNQEDFEESRIPLWSMKFDYYVGPDSEIQFVYLPKFEPAFFPGAGHPFAIWAEEFYDVLEREGVHAPFGDVNFNVKYDKPATTFGNSEYGFMWRQNFGDWSYSLNYLSHKTDTSGADLTGITVDPITHLLTDIELTRRNNRMHSIGGSFDATFSHLPGIGTIIVRGETIYNINNIMANIPNGGMALPVDVTGPGGDVVWGAGTPFPETVNVNDLTYALGFDKYVFTDYFLSFQFIQHHIMNWKSSYVNAVTGTKARRNDYWFTFLAQKDYLNEKLWVKLLNVVGHHGDFWIQPQVSYLLWEKIKFNVQGNFYGGAPGNMWSRFDDADNIALRVTYQF